MLITTASRYISATRAKRYTSYCSQMRLIAKQNIEILIINSKSSILGNRGKVLATRGEIHTKYSIMMMLNCFLYFPVLSAPDDDSTKHFGFTLTA